MDSKTKELAKKVVHLYRRAAGPKHVVKKALTYSEDGLLIYHVSDFLKDPRFARAYQRGEETGSWFGGRVRWRVHVVCWAAAHGVKLAGDFV